MSLGLCTPCPSLIYRVSGSTTVLVLATSYELTVACKTHGSLTIAGVLQRLARGVRAE